MNLLAVECVTAGYSVQDVLFEVSVEVGSGEAIAIIGPNGAGKTTLLRTVMGVIKPKSGNISFQGHTITGLPTERIARLGLSWAPQEDNVFPGMTVAENLYMGAYLQKGNIQEQLDEVYGIFPALTEKLHQPAGSLSGGQRQMLAVARGLMIRPQLLLLDEPTSGLAPNLVKVMLGRIKEITNRLNMSVLLVTQTIDALKLCRRGYLLSAGTIIYTDSTDKFIDNPEVRDLYFGGGSSPIESEGL